MKNSIFNLRIRGSVILLFGSTMIYTEIQLD